MLRIAYLLLQFLLGIYDRFCGWNCNQSPQKRRLIVWRKAVLQAPAQKSAVMGGGVFQKWWLILFLGGMWTTAYAVQQARPADQVFKVSSMQLDARTLSIQWAIKPGYYLYRDKIHFDSDLQHIKSVILPPGIAKQNSFQGHYQIYPRDVAVLVRFVHPLPSSLRLTVHYQGCSAAGFCYPPVTTVLALQLHQKNWAALSERRLERVVGEHSIEHDKLPEAMDERGGAMQLLATHNLWLVLLGFFGFGLLLSLTPCVLPLIPILSAIVLGQRQLTTRKALSLSVTYVFSMALTYAVAGVFAGLAGSYLQAFLQSPWVIGFVSLVFVLLAFSLFGCYELRLPARWQEKLTNLSHAQRGGYYLSVAFMGCLSTLVISPCITAPLVGVLTYIGNTGDAVLGGFALFVLGLGSGVPLLIIGVSAGRWLPKSGPWMYWVKIILGAMMLVMAVWLLARLIPADSPLLHGLSSSQGIVRRTSSFQAIKGIAELERALVQAKQENKPVIVDFYANWCLSCKEMERVVLTVPHVQSLLARFMVLRVDVTANDLRDQRLEKKFNVIAPPTFLFFTADGRELSNQRIVGQVATQVFVNRLNQVLLMR